MLKYEKENEMIYDIYHCLLEVFIPNKKLTPLLFDHSSGTHCHSDKYMFLLLCEYYIWITKNVVVMPHTN